MYRRCAAARRAPPMPATTWRAAPREKCYDQASRGSRKVVAHRRDHQVGEALVVRLDVAVMGEPRHDDQPHGLGVLGESFQREDLAPELQPFFLTVDPVAFVELADDVHHALACEAP